MSAVVAAVCVVGALHPDAGTAGVTAIDKRPVDGPVRVGRFGLRGDVQADRKHHGGEDKALYAVDAAEIAWWSAQLGAELAPGAFGENLRVAGLPVDDALLGERWRIGDIEVEVTGPRSPCATFGRWLGQDGWVRRYTERGRPGVYLRVVRGGEVRAGDQVTVLDRPTHGVSVARWFGAEHPEDARAVLVHARSGEWEPADYLRAGLETAAGRAPEPSGSDR
ncbi:MOSC domain-containing protein [Isoptericola sp. b441]|uniref:MOSC domain-containing protein n=1 Tax=Actinotalea lenta TaxID=3064654 RepID=A0ABT9DB50_9CELL|nr:MULTISPECIES: MOSC domain-containing protein [unclassified Isoptericola]MDO8108123.1 MOSC domain-containing protein [Isoptericola sp. b441]MDO8120207.1 MOSC domain-containing protein [Isoptericola sp. b490]